MSLNFQNISDSNAPCLRTQLPEPLKQWSGTPSEYPRDKSVSAVFEQVVSEYPNNTALVFGDFQLTYAELNSRANRVAYRLKHLGLGPETIVGCCIERSPGLIVALVGILKAGAAYLPLDPAYPKDRLDLLLGDTLASAIVTTKSLASTALKGHDRPLLAIEDLAADVHETDTANPPHDAGPENLAYVMYTSGSTGRPKGVMVENRAIVRLVRNTNYCRLAPDEVFLQFAPISFDASTFEIWGPLLNGARLVIAPQKAASLEDLGAIIRENGVTTLWLTAGLFHLIVEQRIDDLHSLRQLLAGGDTLSPTHVRTFLERVPTCTLINGYGPTENTTFTCCHVMRSGDSFGDSVPIGRPISNTLVYILDEQLRPVAPGDIGELYAAGDGVARGYLNDPDATAAKFLPDPFSDNSAGRMYRTGDLGRWLADGVIEFVGRVDHQVKILGYRIEPGEIETVLGTHHGVKQIYVVPQSSNGSKRLVAFYVVSEYRAASPQQLREFAAEKLPQYMIPAHFVELSALPLSPNGKVDRSALAQMALPAKDQARSPNNEAPQSELEAALQSIWSRVLRLPKVGLDDNFFDLGGDSLLIVAVHSNLQKILRTELRVTDLFEFTTIRKLAAHISEKQRKTPSFVAIEQQAQKQREAFANFSNTTGRGEV